MRRLATTVTTALATIALALGLGMSPAAAITSNTYEYQVLHHSNNERRDAGRANLKHQACLDRYAESWAITMANRRSLEHRTSHMLRSIMSKCGLRSIGENIAVGYGSGVSVVGAWMNSAGHRANILNSGFRLHGVGAHYAGGRWWVAQMFGTAR